MFIPTTICVTSNTHGNTRWREEEKFLSNKRQEIKNIKEKSSLTHSLPQTTRLTPQQIEDKREKGLCFNCDRKYSRGNKCTHKLVSFLF